MPDRTREQVASDTIAAAEAAADRFDRESQSFGTGDMRAGRYARHAAAIRAVCAELTQARADRIIINKLRSDMHWQIGLMEAEGDRLRAALEARTVELRYAREQLELITQSHRQERH